MYRVEDKYLLSPSQMTLLEKRIASVLTPDQNNINRKGYQISSLYFDDNYDRCLHDTINGVSPRDKYRIRIYNNSFDTIKLEVKRKKLNRTLKFVSSITKEECQKLCLGETLDRRTDSADDPINAFNTAISTRLLHPSVIVTYDRNAYLYDEGDVRITFDRNLRGSNWTEMFGKPDLVYDYPQGKGGILEVKYNGFLPTFIAQLIENNSMIQTSNSKYRICREIYLG